MKKKLFTAFLCLGVLLQGLAWNTRGHMIVAAIAWDNLDTESRDQVTAMDKEIVALEAKKSKYILIEHGMIQGELLTDQTRLV